jgi:uncharacterized protein YggE
MNFKAMILAIAGILFITSAQAQVARRPPFVSATGRASVFATPDQVKIDATVTADGMTAQAATAQNATVMNALLAALRNVIGPSGDIKTINFNVYPVYRNAPSQAPMITGYSASNTVEVTLTGTSLIGPVIDTASQNGATSIGSLQFSLKDSDPARVQALKLATQQAKGHADSMAAGMGKVVGNIISIQESAGTPAPIYYSLAPGAAGASTTVMPGTLEIQATVVLEAELN